MSLAIFWRIVTITEFSLWNFDCIRNVLLVAEFKARLTEWGKLDVIKLKQAQHHPEQDGQCLYVLWGISTMEALFAPKSDLLRSDTSHGGEEVGEIDVLAAGVLNVVQ